MSAEPQVRVFSRPEDLFEAAAEEFIRLANAAVREKGHFDVALSGGSTPKALFSVLASKPAGTIPWNEIRFFWGDERHVPPDHPDSNYRMANEAMLSLVPIDPRNVFRVPSEIPDAGAAAAQYEQTLRSAFQTGKDGVPTFDLILLGLGPDGHTASLFPGTKALHEKSRLVVANWVDKFKTDRITFTLPVINHAANVMFLVAGKDKAPAMAAVFDGKSDPEQFPAKLVRPATGSLTWLVGQEAAADMRRAS
jgi:6-phosphogluconolactonase